MSNDDTTPQSTEFLAELFKDATVVEVEVGPDDNPADAIMAAITDAVRDLARRKRPNHLSAEWLTGAIERMDVVAADPDAASDAQKLRVIRDYLTYLESERGEYEPDNAQMQDFLTGLADRFDKAEAAELLG